ncbi:MAG: mismatch-specific DNA-glycosylase [Thermaerobacter sp.]|nr:mismatch-specific DNA-glycosylase [Thermaerobacter sp.]
MADPFSGKPVLEDLLREDLRLVICGSAAGTVSAQRQAYYAGPGNRFWRTLCEVGLTDRQLRPEEYPKLLSYGIGLTDVVKTAFGADDELPRQSFSPAAVVEKLQTFRPGLLATNGKRTAQELLGRKTAYGLQPERLAGVPVFVLPSTSGRAGPFFDLTWWKELAARVEGQRGAW